MSDIRFEEMVLLNCDFTMWPESDEDQEEPETAVSEPDFDVEYPSENLLRLRTSSYRDEDTMILYLDGMLHDDRLPFRLTFDVAARFSIDAPELTAEEAQPTLVWLVYPFLRELVHSMTARSPVPPYVLPPLTRLPDPSLDSPDDPLELK